MDCKRSGFFAVAKAIKSSINVLSFLYAQVYFPTYSNSLKETARYLGFAWTEPSSCGLQSILWRQLRPALSPGTRAGHMAEKILSCRNFRRAITLRTASHVTGRLLKKR